MKPDAFKFMLLILGMVIGMNSFKEFGSTFETIAYVLLGVGALWLLIDMYRKGPSHG